MFSDLAPLSVAMVKISAQYLLGLGFVKPKRGIAHNDKELSLQFHSAVCRVLAPNGRQTKLATSL